MKRAIAGIMALTLTAAVALTNVAATQAAGYHEYDMEDYVMQEMKAANIPGISMSVVSDEKEIYSAAFGSGSDPEDDYVLGSLTQSMTALGILRMVEDEEISLKDPLSAYLSDYPKLQDVTIEELLTHTSGIPMSAMLNGRDLYVSDSAGKYEEAYANYNLLGEVIEEVSGETYEEYITENILDPCEMSSTFSLRQNPELHSQVKPTYQTIFGYPNKKQYEYHENQWARVSSGYMLSDVKDMGKYLQMYLKNDGEIMQKDSIVLAMQGEQAIQTSTATNGVFGGQEQYGMGWISTEVSGTQIYYQLSFLENTMSFMLLVPDKNAGIIMMFDEADYMVGRKMTKTICAGVTRILLGEKPGHVKENSYLIQHGIIDVILLLLLIAAWMPIFLIGVWGKRVSRRFRVLRLLKDLLLHIALPTALLILLPLYLGPWDVWLQFAPDIVYVVWAVIASLYFGAVIKVLQWIVIMIRQKLHAGETEEEMQDDPIRPVVKSDTGVVGNFTMIDPLDDELTDDEEEVEEEIEMEEELESEEEELGD
ncbi:MAG: serine hydrolase domain-containing protein [Eubacteriales bacterium]|nr:serine hydrolase domain-containing protein [Eubacteriales bacterium]